jgi:hypothetical protein
MAMGALIQIATLYFNRDTGSLGFQMEPIPYPWQLWITLPFKHWFKAFGPGVSSFFLGGFGVPLAIAAGSIAGLLAFRAPYRDLKIMMGAFALVVALSGMIKVRLGSWLHDRRRRSVLLYRSRVPFLVHRLCGPAWARAPCGNDSHRRR